MVHGGGSTLNSTFDHILPDLARRFQVVAMDLQNHGRSGFRDDPPTFAQDAADVLALHGSFIGESSTGAPRGPMITAWVTDFLTQPLAG